MVTRRTAIRSSQEDSAAAPSVGLALGGGGARGLAHLLMFEAFEELGVKPAILAGTSIGAIFGAAFASGLSVRDMRAHMDEILSVRFQTMRDVFGARARRPTSLLNTFSAPAALLDPEALLEMILPPGTARTFEELEIPLKVVASDFYALEPKVFTSGSLRQAVAASIALPVIFEPVIIEGRAYLDGGLTNPLPFDLLTEEADITVAIDVCGAPVPNSKRHFPTAAEALFASAFIFERTINREKLKSQQPDIYIDAGTGQFQVLDILKMKEILVAAEPAKARLKAQLERVLSVETLEQIAPPGSVMSLAGPAPEPETKPKRRLLLNKLKGRKGRHQV